VCTHDSTCTRTLVKDLSGTARAALKGNRGPRGVQGLQGGQGPNGDQGPPGPYPDVLASGKTIKGAVYLTTTITSYSFGFSLPSVPIVHVRERVPTVREAPRIHKPRPDSYACTSPTTNRSAHACSLPTIQCRRAPQAATALRACSRRIHSPTPRSAPLTGRSEPGGRCGLTDQGISGRGTCPPPADFRPAPQLRGGDRDPGSRRSRRRRLADPVQATGSPHPRCP
jgi:hypothetical protein